MLILTRKRGESIVIGGNVVVTYMGRDQNSDRIKLGISAPDEVPIMRQELLALERPKVTAVHDCPRPVHGSKQ